MGKKKVALNTNPLEAQTIGRVKKHNFGLLSLILIMALFGGVIYHLPTLMSIYDNYTKTGTISFNIVKNNTVSNNTVNPPIEEPVEITYLALNTDNKVTFEDVTFDNILYENNKIKVTVIPNKSSTIVLYNLDYFLRAYDKDKKIVKTYFFSSVVNTKASFSITAQDAVYYNITSFKDSDYPYLLLDVDDDNKSYLTCNKNDTSIKYTFIDEKLTTIEDVVTINNPDAGVKTQYEELKSNYDSMVGLETIIEEGNPFKFTINVDLDKYIGNVKTYYFNKTTSPRIVKYKMEAMNYTCR